MAQSDLTIQNQSFPSFRTDLNNALTALNTTQSGTSTPTGAVAGTIWLDTSTGATTPTLKYYDGTDNISLATLDHVGNTVNWLDSTVSITGLTTTATGTVLTLSDSASTSTVNLIIDNQKEIQFRETTANGTNYVALKAPASVSADLTFTLPATDGTAGQVLSTNGSGVLSFTDVSGGISWQSVQTTGFTASAGNGYPCNTTSAGFTVTLPATPSAGDQVQLVDYAGTFDTNALIIDPNGNKIEGATNNLALTGEREGVLLVYIDSTQGWLATSGINEGTDAFSPAPYSIDFLVIAGGGGGGGTYAGTGGGAGGYRTSTQSVSPTTAITVTVGNGGAGSAALSGTVASSGSNSSISGSGLTTITSAGGGGGGNNSPSSNGASGGSGAGAIPVSPFTGGLGNTPSTSPSQGNNGGAGQPAFTSGGGGGGAGAVGAIPPSNSQGGNGGDGTASSITGSSVTRGGGGGAAPYTAGGGTTTSGGAGGGGAGSGGAGSAGTANTGGGGGGSDRAPNSTGGAGGKGVVILSMLATKYTGTTTGSPTVTDNGSYKVLVFNGSGSYTA